jgi:uncharacterized membrane protein YedE/YeeE
VHDFTPVHALVGGALIALGLAAMLIGTGRIAGLSGVIALLVRSRDRAWRAWFVVGMLAVGLAFELAAPRTFDMTAPRSLPVVAISGVLVGIGTRLSNGCTSGHGLCGTSRLSKRSIVATAVFFGVGVVTATIVGARYL